jgi:hypothetical protein
MTAESVKGVAIRAVRELREGTHEGCPYRLDVNGDRFRDRP